MAFQEVSRNEGKQTRPGHSGELHWNARLTHWEVREIIRRCEQGEAYAAIAESYGVTRKHVLMIHRGKARTNG
jgi:hypothetical protein